MADTRDRNSAHLMAAMAALVATNGQPTSHQTFIIRPDRVRYRRGHRSKGGAGRSYAPRPKKVDPTEAAARNLRSLHQRVNTTAPGYAKRCTNIKKLRRLARRALAA